jgi:hypothetical protein
MSRPTDEAWREAILDAALDGYPRQDLPAGFVTRTMARLQPQARRQRPLRPQFLDMALPLLFAGLTALALVLWRGLAATVDPRWPADVRLAAQLAYNDLAVRLPLPLQSPLLWLIPLVGAALMAGWLVLEERTGSATGPST